MISCQLAVTVTYMALIVSHLTAAVVLMEFSGTFVIELPALLAVITAYTICAGTRNNVYDSVMALNGEPCACMRSSKLSKCPPEIDAPRRSCLSVRLL